MPNTCKACALGMGGQRGSRTNELGVFPSVCRKSLQADFSDTQAPITAEVLARPLTELAALSGRELEHLGRLNTVLYKAAGASGYAVIDWPAAYDLLATRFQQSSPERTFFYTSGRSSNEAGFVLQLLARLYGTNNVNNCSYYCHQATSEGLKTTIGTSTATVDLEQLSNSDCIFVIGANPASNHPRFLTILKACLDRGGQVIVINPAREPGFASLGVSDYLQPRVGSDPWLFKGLAKAVLEAGTQDHDFIQLATQGFEAFANDLKDLDWPSIEQNTGLSEQRIREVAQKYARSENAVFAWGMGMTHHLHGSNNVEAIANLALIRANVGKPAAGLLPLRGHSNIQGMGTMGVKPTLAIEVFEHLERTYGVKLPTAKGLDTLGCLEAASRGEMDAALLLGGNLFSATPNSDWAEAALDKIGFKVFLTTTLNRGHVVGMTHSEALILPVSARDEEQQATTQESMFNFIRLSDGGPVRLDNVRSEVEILCTMAETLLPGAPVDFSQFREHRRVQQAIAAAIPGMAPLKNILETKQEFTVEGRVLLRPEFPTTHKKANFVVRPAPVSLATAAFPFVLASVRSEGQFNSIVYEESDKFRKTATRWCILLNPEDVAKLGLVVGGTADVRSAVGELSGLTVYAFDVPTGNALMYYPEANALIATDHDPRSKTPAFKSTAVSIVARRR